METPSHFTFDPVKNERNVRERGIAFSLVEAGFNFRSALVATDDRRNYGEVREVALGFIGERLHVLVFTMRGDTCHVISLRKANSREVRHYVEAI